MWLVDQIASSHIKLVSVSLYNVSSRHTSTSCHLSVFLHHACSRTPLYNKNISSLPDNSHIIIDTFLIWTLSFVLWGRGGFHFFTTSLTFLLPFPIHITYTAIPHSYYLYCHSPFILPILPFPIHNTYTAIPHSYYLYCHSPFPHS